MEKVDYRDTLAWLDELFEGKKLLTPTEVANAFKIDRRTAQKRYPFTDSKIEITRLASCMCLSSQDVRNAYHVK